MKWSRDLFSEIFSLQKAGDRFSKRGLIDDHKRNNTHLFAFTFLLNWRPHFIFCFQNSLSRG